MPPRTHRSPLSEHDIAGFEAHRAQAAKDAGKASCTKAVARMEEQGKAGELEEAIVCYQ